MSKDKSKKKDATPPTHEEALANLESAKEAKKAAYDAREAFSKKNGLPPKKDHSSHKEFGKAFSPLNQAWLDAKDAITEAEKIEKEVRPKSERPSKYDYPADIVTADDKKKYRAKMRAKVKSDAKSPTEGKPKKDKAKDEAPAGGDAAKEVSKKKKKKNKASTKED